MAGRRLAIGSFALLAAVGTFGMACGGGGGSASPVAATPGAPAGTTAPGSGNAAEQPASGPQSQVGVALNMDIPTLGPRVIKTATVHVEVSRGTFETAFQRAVEVAGRHGGFVASSQTSRETRPHGSLTLRVPADQFEAALGELKALGTVTGQDVSGEDVTSKFVDLEARQRNWEAQETVLLRLMDRASTIDESIKVQRALQDVQLAIEQIRGQLRLLTDQTSFSTITMAMSEAGKVVSQPKPKGQKGTLTRAWEHARDGFVGVISAVVIGIGYILPFAVLVVVPALIWLAVIRRARSRGAPAG